MAPYNWKIWISRSVPYRSNSTLTLKVRHSGNSSLPKAIYIGALLILNDIFQAPMIRNAADRQRYWSDWKNIENHSRKLKSDVSRDKWILKNTKRPRIHTTLYLNLGMRKLFCKLVSHLLIMDQMRRVGSLLREYQHFVPFIVFSSYGPRRLLSFCKFQKSTVGKYRSNDEDYSKDFQKASKYWINDIILDEDSFDE